MATLADSVRTQPQTGFNALTQHPVFNALTQYATMVSQRNHEQVVSDELSGGLMCGPNAKSSKQQQMGRKPWLTWQAFVCIETEAGVFYHHSSSYLHESACSDPDSSCIAGWPSSRTGEGRGKVDTCSAASLHFSLAMSSGSPCDAARPCSDLPQTQTTGTSSGKP